MGDERRLIARAKNRKDNEDLDGSTASLLVQLGWAGSGMIGMQVADT